MLRSIVGIAPAAILAFSTFACSSAGEDVASSANALSACNPGYVYCGEHERIRGEIVASGQATGNLYRCTADRELAPERTCANGCTVQAVGDDTCNGAAGNGPDLAAFPPRAGSQVWGKDVNGALVPRNAPTYLVKDPAVEYFVLAPAPLEDGVAVYTEGLRIDRQSGMCETAEKVRTSAGLSDNPDRSASAAGIRKLVRFDAAVLNAGTTAIPFGGATTSVDRSTGATSSRLVDRRLFSYSACHAHDHMNGFAIYRLLGEDGTPVMSGNVQVTGRKQGFCIGDTIQYGSGPNQIASLINNRCADMVLSPGFADVYAREDSIHKRFLGGQWIDVTGVPGGTYAVELEVNPAVAPNANGECEGGLVKCESACRLFCESDYGNNIGRAAITIPSTPCMPTDVNNGGTDNPTTRLGAPEATFRARLAELSASVAGTCGAITGAAACEANVATGTELLTARTTNGCTLRYHWERYNTGTVGPANAELEVEQGCAKTYNGQTCGGAVTGSCYEKPECVAGQYFDVWKDSCGATYKTRVPSADASCN